jgi:hypothetical protein
MPAIQRTPGRAAIFFLSQHFFEDLAAHAGHLWARFSMSPVGLAQDEVVAGGSIFELQHEDTDAGACSSSRFSVSEQQDLFPGGADRFLRDSTRGRTCSGGSMPLTSAQASFSSSVKQQQSPFQHSLALRQPQGRFWQGNGRLASLSLAKGVAGSGNPNVTKRWLISVSTTTTSRGRTPNFAP